MSLQTPTVGARDAAVEDAGEETFRLRALVALVGGRRGLGALTDARTGELVRDVDETMPSPRAPVRAGPQRLAGAIERRPGDFSGICLSWQDGQRVAVHGRQVALPHPLELIVAPEWPQHPERHTLCKTP